MSFEYMQTPASHHADSVSPPRPETPGNPRRVGRVESAARWLRIGAAASMLALQMSGIAFAQAPAKEAGNVASTAAVSYRTVNVEGVNVFYREAGPKDAPALLLLHGFPTSSQMFRNLIPRLAGKYRVIAPDYPGYGQSDMPAMDKFQYSFDNLARVIDKFTTAIGVTRFAIYVQDYGAPVGYRIAAAHPERITAIVVQNGNAYDEGIDNEFWVAAKAYWSDKTPANGAKLRTLFELPATKWQYSEGVRDIQRVSPDAWTVDQAYMDRPGNKDIQLEMFYSYGSNPPLYPAWQAYFRKHQPPMLIVWGKNDKIFPPRGCASLPARPAQGRAAPARYRPFRPGRRQRKDRGADAELSPKATPVSAGARAGTSRWPHRRRWWLWHDVPRCPRHHGVLCP